jgi:hypothetical protein
MAVIASLATIPFDLEVVAVPLRDGANLVRVLFPADASADSPSHCGLSQRP